MTLLSSTATAGYSLLPAAPRPHVGGRAADPVCQARPPMAPMRGGQNKLQQTLSAIASLRPQKGVVTLTSPADVADASDAASSRSSWCRTGCRSRARQAPTATSS